MKENYEFKNKKYRKDNKFSFLRKDNNYSSSIIEIESILDGISKENLITSYIINSNKIDKKCEKNKIFNENLYEGVQIHEFRFLF